MEQDIRFLIEYFYLQVAYFLLSVCLVIDFCFVYIFLFSELAARIPTDNSKVHVINIDIQDNHEEATIGAFLILELAQLLSQSDDLDNDIDELLQDFEAKSERSLLHSIAFQWKAQWLVYSIFCLPVEFWIYSTSCDDISLIFRQLIDC